MAKDPYPYSHWPQDQAGLEALAKSIDEAMADYERNGPASPEDVRRMLDEAKLSGLARRERRVRATQKGGNGRQPG